MKITVTEEDIAKGVRGGCKRCPVALALRRTSPDSEVYKYECRVNRRTYKLPVKVWIFVKDFDYGNRVFPFTFELPIDQ